MVTLLSDIVPPACSVNLSHFPFPSFILAFLLTLGQGPSAPALLPLGWVVLSYVCRGRGLFCAL